MKLPKLVSMVVVWFLLTSAVAGCRPTPTPTIMPTTAPTTVPQPTMAPTVVPEQPTAAPTAEVQPTAEPTAAPAAGCPKEGGQLVVGLSWEPSKIDPHRTAAENGILPIMQACETLVIRTPTGEFVPGLADSWEISSDGMSYTFHLHRGIKFHDGTPFNAEAVKYNFDRLVDPATKSEEGIDHLGPYESTEVVDEYTAVVHLKSPFAPLLDGISSGWLCMVSPTAAKQWGPDEFQDHFVGTGPFVFKEWKRHEYILLEKNPDYWGGPAFFKHQGNACLDSIMFKFVEEAAVRSGTLETGEIQIAQEVPTVDVERLKAKPDIQVLVMPGPGTGIMLLFNMSRTPTDDLRIRQALNYGIDQQAISDMLYQGVMEPAYGPLSPVTPCYWSGVEQMYPYDPEKARALLEEAGWKDENGDGIREKDGQPLVLEFPTHGGFPLYRDPAPIVQAQLKEIGVDVNVQNLAAPAWLEAGRTGNLNIGILDWRASDPDFDLRLPFLSTNADAFAWNHHNNTKLDELLMQGMSITDLQERCRIYEDIQKIIMEDAMIKPLHVYAAIYGVRNEVKDLKFDLLAPSMFWAFDAYLDK